VNCSENVVKADYIVKEGQAEEQKLFFLIICIFSMFKISFLLSQGLT
jgi:hypothetical protein